ncbi:MAG: metal ABC transporter permease [Ktedonobacteraceae bacterium]|nr:metal ABC transporter permease [Ktedonobacteraceae bacterium]MBO0791395.1 metal ABC transporter permease [Ktedonobacteraceae bacterium]
MPGGNIMFDLLQQDFVQNAFLAGTIVAIVTAVVGYFVILRAQAFASDALTDMGFAGATAAAILGISSFLGMLLMTLLSALGLGALGERVRGRDVETGMVLSFGLGLGVLFLSLYAQRSNADARTGTGMLFGSLLSISSDDVWIVLGCGIVVLLLLALIFRPLLFASIDPVVARTRGVPVRLLSVVFLVLVGITAAEAVLVVGVLLVTALLIAPAATAQQLARRPFTAMLLSVLFSLFFTWGGLLLAFLDSQLPVSFSITALATAWYLLALLVSRRGSPRRFARGQEQH